MKWNPLVDVTDYGAEAVDDRLQVGAASGRAYAAGRLSPEVVAEQEKLVWADTVVVQFPLWWFGVPAILKGWIDRVFIKGFAYGLSGEDGRTLHYGEGRLAGKRAMVVVTGGASDVSLGPRGINGSLDDLLFSLEHGTFFYTGMAVLPPFALYRADRVPDEQYVEAHDSLVGDRAPGVTGTAIHLR